MIQTVNPATGQVVQTYSSFTASEIQSRLGKASESYSWWRQQELSKRAELVFALAKEFRAQKDSLAELMTLEMGKSHKEGVSEIEKCADTFDYFAKNASHFLKPEPVPIEGLQAEVHFESLGVILSIMPWNFPFWQFVRFAAPSLMIGNVILLKHSNITSGCAARIEDICNKLSQQPLIFNLRIDHDQAAEVMKSSLIKGVTFTGSTKGGREIAKTAGEALKKTVLELGGSDAYLILKDADIAEAAKICAAGRMINAGQSCVAAKRFIAVPEIFEEFVSAFKKELEKFPPALLAHEKFKNQLQEQVEKLTKLGGKILLGGKADPGKNAFYPPSLMIFEKAPQEVHAEELFGPVAMVFRAENEDQAFKIANASPFGLGGGIFSKDTERAKNRIAKDLDAGYVIVNGTVRSDPRLPFGGVKDSGYGRELSIHGFREFCNVKTVVVTG
jgi:succinate-semialdehyde dehydrogenase/glutarate-semialdehyde dehydrogenase